MIRLKSLLLACFCLFASHSALAWGQIGHRVVGQIAENHLTKKARKNIAELLGHEDLAIVSTWMDEIRSDGGYGYASTWHWVTIPDGMRYEDTEKNPSGDVVEAIERMKVILKSDTASRESKIRALKFLVHLVGDIHQPLHVGTGKDRGGNNMKVVWFQSSSNLHRVWDSDIIDQKQFSYSELAKAIDHASQDEIARLQKGCAEDWANEVMEYREQVYNVRDPEDMRYAYMYRNWELVQQQLEKAGIRLAGVLNEIFG